MILIDRNHHARQVERKSCASVVPECCTAHVRHESKRMCSMQCTAYVISKAYIRAVCQTYSYAIDKLYIHCVCVLCRCLLVQKADAAHDFLHCLYNIDYDFKESLLFESASQQGSLPSLNANLQRLRIDILIKGFRLCPKKHMHLKFTAGGVQQLCQSQSQASRQDTAKALQYSTM